MIRRKRAEGIEQKNAKCQLLFALQAFPYCVDVAPCIFAEKFLPQDQGRKLGEQKPPERSGDSSNYSQENDIRVVSDGDERQHRPGWRREDRNDIQKENYQEDDDEGKNCVKRFVHVPSRRLTHAGI